MKRFVVTILVILFTSGMVYAQNIGENYEGGGISFWGGGNIHLNFGNVFQEDSEWSYYAYRINPGLTYYVYDYMSIWSGLNFNYSTDAENSQNIVRSMEYGINMGGRYHIVPNPEASRGLAYSVGGVVGFSLEPGIDSTVNGNTVKDDSLRYKAKIGPAFRASYYLRERISIYIDTNPQLVWYSKIADKAGNDIDHPDFFENETQFRINVSFGIQRHIPNKDAVLVE